MHMYVKFQEQKTENPDIKCKNQLRKLESVKFFLEKLVYICHFHLFFFGGGVQVKILKIRAERGIKGNR